MIVAVFLAMLALISTQVEQSNTQTFFDGITAIAAVAAAFTNM
jgi:hypothetical protein